MGIICLSIRLLFASFFRQRVWECASLLCTLILTSWLLTEVSLHLAKNSIGCVDCDFEELLSKYVGAWNVKFVEETKATTQGLSEISFVVEDWFEERLTIGDIAIRTFIEVDSKGNDRVDGNHVESLNPLAYPMKGSADVQSQSVTFDCVERLDSSGEEVSLRYLWIFPKDGAFVIARHLSNAEGPLTKVKTMEYSQEVERQPPDRSIGREILRQHLGDWEIVSELDNDGLQLPVRSEGGIAPGGDPTAFMRIADDYLSELPWDRTKDPETLIRESAYIVEWTDSSREGIRGELYYEFEGARKHVASCIMKVVGNRALLRIDQPPRNKYESPFKVEQFESDHLGQFQIFSMVRASVAGTENKKQ